MPPAPRSGVIALCLLALAGCSGGGGGGDGGSPPAGSAPAATSALQPASETSLTGYFRSALQRDASYAGDTLAYAQVSAALGAPTAATSAASSFSTTTLQETGVDEADLVKTDGSVIYSISASGSARTIRRHRIPASGTALALMEDYAPQFGAAKEELTKLAESDPPDRWEAERKEYVRGQLQWAVDLYAKLS